jgi:putative transposase
MRLRVGRCRVSRQLELRLCSRGGARRGAGRKPNGRRAGVSHLRRPTVSRHHPQHVTLRVCRGLPVLRVRELFRAVLRALAQGNERFGFRLIHYSVQQDHVHLIAEASDRSALSRGVQGLSVRIARAVNRQLGRTGSVFADRYHARALKTPQAVRVAVRYVLLNVRKHDRSAVPKGSVDPCSSAAWFGGFARPLDRIFGVRACREVFAGTVPGRASPVVEAQTWLLRVGLRRAGTFDVDEVPG